MKNGRRFDVLQFARTIVTDCSDVAFTVFVAHEDLKGGALYSRGHF